MRDYDPTTGRYLQADPLGLVDGASVYGYALQNPGRYVDPRGECAGPLALGCAALAGALLSAGMDILLQLALHDDVCPIDIDWFQVGAAGALGAIPGTYAYAYLKNLHKLHRYRWSTGSGKLHKAFGTKGLGTHEMHHGLLRAMGRHGQPSLRHNILNVNPMKKPVHRRVHGKWNKRPKFSKPKGIAIGLPPWAKVAVASTLGGAALESLD